LTPSALETASPTPAASPSPTAPARTTAPVQTPTAAEVAAARTAVDQYTAALVRGDYTTAWQMLAPGSEPGLTFAEYKLERAGYFASVQGRYSVQAQPTDIGPITQWLPAPGVAIDLSHAVLVEVTYPGLAAYNVWDVYLVTPGANGLQIYSVR